MEELFCDIEKIGLETLKVLTKGELEDLGARIGERWIEEEGADLDFADVQDIKYALLKSKEVFSG